MDPINLIEQVSKCVICEPHLPLGARPVIQFNANARILIAGQAPGIKVHETGKPFNDASGNRLREWLGLSVDEFNLRLLFMFANSRVFVMEMHDQQSFDVDIKLNKILIHA